MNHMDTQRVISGWLCLVATDQCLQHKAPTDNMLEITQAHPRVFDHPPQMACIACVNVRWDADDNRCRHLLDYCNYVLIVRRLRDKHF